MGMLEVALSAIHFKYQNALQVSRLQEILIYWFHPQITPRIYPLSPISSHEKNYQKEASRRISVVRHGSFVPLQAEEQMPPHSQNDPIQLL